MNLVVTGSGRAIAKPLPAEKHSGSLTTSLFRTDKMAASVKNRHFEALIVKISATITCQGGKAIQKRCDQALIYSLAGET